MSINWLMPVFKRKSIFDAANYKGIHLTTDKQGGGKGDCICICAAADIKRSIRPKPVRLHARKTCSTRFGTADTHLDMFILEEAQSGGTLFRCVRSLWQSQFPETDTETASTRRPWPNLISYRFMAVRSESPSGGGRQVFTGHAHQQYGIPRDGLQTTVMERFLFKRGNRS